MARTLLDGSIGAMALMTGPLAALVGALDVPQALSIALAGAYMLWRAHHDR